MSDKIQTGLGIEDLIADKREAVLRLAKQYKAYNVRVFGSAARGEAAPNSDIDFLVDFQLDYTLWDHIGLQQELEELLGRRVDVTIERNLREEFRPYIMRDVVAL